MRPGAQSLCWCDRMTWDDLGSLKERKKAQFSGATPFLWALLKHRFVPPATAPFGKTEVSLLEAH